MEITTPPKSCPICKQANKQNALVCDFCGVIFVESFPEIETTKDMTYGSVIEPVSHIDELKPPIQGMAFFLFGKTQPFSVQNEDVVYLGRVERETTEAFVDLSLVNGFDLGVSRRHAMIQRYEDRCEIMDLHSSNGTSLDGNILLPSKFYELKSGMVIQLGRVKLIPIFSWAVHR